MTSIVYIHYSDIGITGKHGCGFFMVHREVRNVEAVDGGHQGVIWYRKKEYPVYRGHRAISWSSNRDVLQTPKCHYLRKGVM